MGVERDRHRRRVGLVFSDRFEFVQRNSARVGIELEFAIQRRVRPRCTILPIAQIAVYTNRRGVLRAHVEPVEIYKAIRIGFVASEANRNARWWAAVKAT